MSLGLQIAHYCVKGRKKKTMLITDITASSPCLVITTGTCNSVVKQSGH